MKKYLLLVFLLVAMSNKKSSAQNVAINNSGSIADNSAILDVQSTTKGLLVPKMNQAQRNLISSPAVGLLIYQTDVIPGYYFYNGGSWIQFSTGTATNYWALNGTNIYSGVTGNVGIGTSAPTAKLQLAGNMKINGNNSLELGAGLTKESNAGKIGYQLFTADAVDIVGAGTTGLNRKIKFWNEGGAFFAGKVGIGLNNPASMLTILSNTINSANNTDVLQVAGSNPMQVFSNEGGVNVAYLKGVTNLAPTPQYPKQGLEIGATPNNSVYLSANYGPVLTVASNNNVGIGTTNPTYKLSVNGNTINSANNTDILQVAGSNPMQVFSNEGGVNVAYLKGVTNLAPTPQYPKQGLEIGATPNNSIYLSANYGPVLTVASNNNVGIGTTNPTYKLSVNGNIRSKEVIVETGWADYVFAENYPLIPLREVEKFIMENKHLPNIPSAKEVATNGLYVGDTQKRMMEKIEELTLYLIALEKKVNQLETKLKNTAND